MERLDRKAFKMQTYSQASNNFDYWSSRSEKERLEAANYLISVAYNFPINNPPRMDKGFFKISRRE